MPRIPQSGIAAGDLMSSKVIIDVRDLWFFYDRHLVLKEVNLSVNEGDFIALIGPNGGGKTTLLKLILGLLRPNRGTVQVLGRSPKEASPKLGYVPQDIHINIDFPISVRDVVLMGGIKEGEGWGYYSGKEKEKARAALEKVDMWSFHQRRIGDLSGGQRQRVFLARALVSDPLILLLDEPTSNIDSQGQAAFYDLLKELNNSTTILIVSHDLLVLSSYIRSVACISRQLIFHEAPEITKDMIEMAYHCPVELIAHGLPHRVLDTHEEDQDD
jgi:zinc transport system ATP-binding protein